MKDKPDYNPQQPTTALFVTEREMAPMLGVSVFFLQKDRRGAQRIPFVRLGDRCLYDPQDVLATVKATTEGGSRGRRSHIGRSAK